MLRTAYITDWSTRQWTHALNAIQNKLARSTCKKQANRNTHKENGAENAEL
jgi:hypothetical protein